MPVSPGQRITPRHARLSSGGCAGGRRTPWLDGALRGECLVYSEDARHVAACLAVRRYCAAVSQHSVLARVVGREHQSQVAFEQTHEIRQVARAGAQVGARVQQILYTVAAAGVGHHLHQPDRPFGGHGFRVVCGLDTDHSMHERRVDARIARCAYDLLMKRTPREDGRHARGIDVHARGIDVTTGSGAPGRWRCQMSSDSAAVALPAEVENRSAARHAVEGAPRPYIVSASPRRLELANAELRLPSAVLGIASSQVAPLLLTGELTMRVPRIAIKSDGVNGDAVLRWSGAGSTLVPFVHFGDYELRADTTGEGARARLRTIDGPLTLTGEGTWAPHEPVRMRVRARVAESHYEKLAPLLRLIALERRDGVFELALR